MADDDEDDCFMTEDALKEAKVKNEIRFVGDGEELMDYLYHRGKFTGPERSPRPGLILLDLNMPRKDGRESLKEIKEDAVKKILEAAGLSVDAAKVKALVAALEGANIEEAINTAAVAAAAPVAAAPAGGNAEAAAPAEDKKEEPKKEEPKEEEAAAGLGALFG